MPAPQDTPLIFAQDDARAAAILARRADGLIALDEALAELADADCGPAIAELIAKRANLGTESVLRGLAARDDQAISVLCRAAGFNINGYSAVLRLRRRHGCGGSETPADALMFFSTLPRASAERIVAQMAVRDPGERVA